MPNNLALVQADPRTSIDLDWWNMAKEQASVLVKTGFLPKSIQNAEQALAIMLKGKELGVPAMYALSNITVIQGKPTANAELMLALVYRDHGKNAIRVAETTNESCTVEWKSWGETKSYTFTMDDAKQAGLLSNQTWQKYPAAMLRARCISAVCRMAFPESIGGMYAPDEMGGDVVVDEDGVVNAAVAAPERPRATVTVLPTSDTTDGHAYDPMELPVTQDKFKRLFAMSNELGMDDDAVHAFLGFESFKGMTRRQYDEAVDKLQAAIDAKVAADEQSDAVEGNGPIEVDAETGEILDDTPELAAMITAEQVETILSKSLDKGFSELVVRDRITKLYGTDLPGLTYDEAEEVIARIDAPMKGGK